MVGAALSSLRKTALVSTSYLPERQRVFAQLADYLGPGGTLTLAGGERLTQGQLRLFALGKSDGSKAMSALEREHYPALEQHAKKTVKNGPQATRHLTFPAFPQPVPAALPPPPQAKKPQRAKLPEDSPEVSTWEMPRIYDSGNPGRFPTPQLPQRPIPIMVRRSQREFGDVCAVTDAYLYIHKGKTLREVHFATGISIAELKAMSGLSNEDAPVTAPTRAPFSEAQLDAGLPLTVRNRIASNGKEERLCDDPARKWTERSGFKVDRSDPNRYIVKIKIHLDGPRELTDKVRAQEQKTEAVLSRPDLIVDVEYVDSASDDAQSVKIYDGWPFSDRWNPAKMDAHTYAHEIGHLLGLPDTYDLREHCDNKDMTKLERTTQCIKGHLQNRTTQEDLMGSGSKLTRKQVEEIAGV